MLVLENMLICTEIRLSVKQFVGLMYSAGKAGTNYISRATFIGTCHVCLMIFTNTEMIAQ